MYLKKYFSKNRKMTLENLRANSELNTQNASVRASVWLELCVKGVAEKYS